MRSSSAPQCSSFSAAFVPLARKLSAPLGQLLHRTYVALGAQRSVGHVHKGNSMGLGPEKGLNGGEIVFSRNDNIRFQSIQSFEKSFGQMDKAGSRAAHLAAFDTEDLRLQEVGVLFRFIGFPDPVCLDFSRIEHRNPPLRKAAAQAGKLPAAIGSGNIADDQNMLHMLSFAAP